MVRRHKFNNDSLLGGRWASLSIEQEEQAVLRRWDAQVIISHLSHVLL
jgi:hypothetical protein